MATTSDVRTLHGQPDPAGIQHAKDCIRRLLTAQIDTARSFLSLHRSRAYEHESCASLVEFAARHGSDAGQTLLLRDLALALEKDAGLEAELREGKIPLPNAAMLGELHRARALKPGDPLGAAARSLPPGTFRRKARRRLAEVRQGTTKLTEMVLHLPDRTVEDFERARTIASRKAGTTLTREDTLAAVLDHYLDDFDPERSGQGTGKRRVPARPAGAPTRYVPADVRRRLRKLFGDRCAVPGCTNRIFLHKAHVTAHAAGGDQEVGNQIPLCSVHHALFDQGRLTIVEWLVDGRVVFETEDGTLLRPDDPKDTGTNGPDGPPKPADPHDGPIRRRGP